MEGMTSQQLLEGIKIFLDYYSILRKGRKWCEDGCPDGAVGQCFASLLCELKKRIEDDKVQKIIEEDYLSA